MPVDVHAEVLSNTRLSADYNVLALAAPEIASEARPGQFVMIKTRLGFEPLLRRPFSIFEILRDAQGAPTGLTILNKRIGVGTGQLFDLAAGDRVDVLGPLGRPFTLAPPSTEAWLVAGGVGLAPFATMAEALLPLGVKTTLFYGARRAQDLYYADWFAARGVTVVTSTEDGSAGDRGFVTAPLARAFDALGRRRLADAPGEDGRSQPARAAGGSAAAPVALYVCGPTPMMRAVSDLAEQHGCDAEVSLEQTMGCGQGGCYSCVVRVRGEGRTPHFVRSCVNGPVFRGRDIVWEELAH
jgi:dihydroorotate dehydrogenase electron transfer subunit